MSGVSAPDPTLPADRTPTVVVVGGTGFVGRNACRTLVDAGYRVVALARRAVDPPAGCQLVGINLATASTDELAALLRREDPAAVVNAAGALWPVNGVQMTDEQLTVSNYTLVDRLVAAVGSLPGRPRLIHLGSTYEYGEQPPDALLSESTIEKPFTHYTRTKLASTRTVLAAARSGQVDATVLRLTTTVGPWAPPSSLFGQVAHGLAARPEVLQLPALEGERDLVDVRDVSDAILAAAGSRTVAPLYNIASGHIVAISDAVEMLIRLADLPISIAWGPRETHRRDAQLIGSQHIDISAARQLPWSPRRTLTDTLAALWRSVQPTGTSQDAELAGR
ncbi:MAG: NAD(P)-dependent oxidoreductase [Actinocatenispora sp.]